jgi:class 3 adenylate cyclase/tetratricopeptide (TPR) repeat protein
MQLRCRSPCPRETESYTPKHLAEKILTSKAALEGERKQVTVLFADLKGSMELLADRDAEEARKLLDPVLTLMMDAVHHYEGTVNQVMGDGIMALFGAPLAHEDHAVRACYAALRMQESVAQYAEGVFRSHGVPLQIRVGLNSGEVVVRAIGSDLHMDYTAVGQTTHLAARMEQMATPGSILLAPATLQLAEGYVQVAARGPVAVKGLPDPVEIYALTGASGQRTRFHAAAARGLTRFVGRDAEIEQLRRALALAHDGHGQLVALVGEPGVGKSRLVYEFTHSHRTQDWLILEAGSVSYGKATSYLPVIDLLKAYLKVHDREPHREIREKVTGKLLTLDRTLEPTLPALLALLDVPNTQWQALDPPQRRRRTLDAVKRLLLRECQLQPLLVVFEDLHWIDSETQALLDSLVESLPTARLLLLVNYRPEYSHGWGSKTYYTQLRLDALPPESANELLLALLGTDAAWGEEGIRLAETDDHPWSLVLACGGAGLASLRQGDLSKAIPVLERGLRLCQSAQLPLFFPRLASALGLAYAQSGRLAEGLPLLEQAVEQSTAMQTVFLHTLWLIHLGEGHRLAGRPDEAAHGARRALELARAHQERGHHAYALRLLGEVAAHREPPEIEPAETHYRQAMALAEELGMRPLVAHCQLGLGQLSRRTGKREQARDHLTTATTLYREMDMRFWLEQAEAEMKGLA